MVLLEEAITKAVIAAAFEVHSTLGPGLLERAYALCLAHELYLRELPVAREVRLPLEYKGLIVPAAYRIDLVVSGRVIVEAKAVERLTAAHEAQLLTYLRLSGLHVGLLINFKERRLTNGLRRRVL